MSFLKEVGQNLRRGWCSPSPLPGFKLALSTTLLWLSIVVLCPLTALMIQASSLSFETFLGSLIQPRVQAALGLSFRLAFWAALVDSGLGLWIAWVLTRYDFWGRRLFDALVDLPFALPTAVAGLALTTLYSSTGWLGYPLHQIFGLEVAFSPAGIFVALVFVGLPFVVRTLQPLLALGEPEVEEASAILGARRLQTFLYVILPPLIPGLLTSFALAFARALGEYGSVVFISGNIPFVSEIAPLLIVIKLEEFDTTGATSLAVIVLFFSLLSLWVMNGIQAWARRRLGYG